MQAQAGAPNPAMKASFEPSLPKARVHAPPSGDVAHVPQQEAQSAAALEAAAPQRSAVAPSTATNSPGPATTLDSSPSPASRIAAPGVGLAASGLRGGAEEASMDLPSAAQGITPEATAGYPSKEALEPFEEHESSRLFGASAMAGKVRHRAQE